MNVDASVVELSQQKCVNLIQLFPFLFFYRRLSECATCESSSGLWTKYSSELDRT